MQKNTMVLTIGAVFLNAKYRNDLSQPVTILINKFTCLHFNKIETFKLTVLSSTIRNTFHFRPIKHLHTLICILHICEYNVYMLRIL